MSTGDEYVVTFGRWDATQRENDRRLGVLERHAEALAGAEQEHRGLADRITALEQAGKASVASERGRRERAWALALVLIGSLVLPILITAVTAFLHIKNYH